MPTNKETIDAPISCHFCNRAVDYDDAKACKSCGQPTCAKCHVEAKCQDVEEDGRNT